jgi:hypothetical protein
MRVEMSSKKKTLLYGVGENDSDYPVNQNRNGVRVKCPFYARWHAMLTRCYSPLYVARFPTYLGCKVAEDWHRFSQFRKWMVNQKWSGMELDKDLLGDGKTYSSSTCVFVAPVVNSFMLDGSHNRGNYPIGVSRHRNGKFVGQLSLRGSVTYLGLFDTPEDAHIAWVKSKCAIGNRLADQQEDPRVAVGLRRYVALLMQRYSVFV